jgi:hypothetical protein
MASIKETRFLGFSARNLSSIKNKSPRFMHA